MRKTATQEELWGRLLVAGHPEDVLWKNNEGRANWIQSLGLSNDLHILDVGCGNGYLDICLARRGHQVVGVDRLVAVLHEAQERAGSDNVRFLSRDLRNVDFDDASFDLVLMFGVVGLMSTDGDSDLLTRVNRWLKPGGQLLIDCDKGLAVDGTSGSIDRSDGQFRWTWTSDPETRLNHMVPEFETPNGTIFEMADPYESERGDHMGLIRYIYPKDELITMLASAGFTTTEVPHYLSYVLPDLEDDSYAFLCSSKKI